MNNNTPATTTTATPLMTDDERAGYIRMLEAIMMDDPTINARRQKMAKAVLNVIRVSTLTELNKAVLKAAAKEIAPELFD